MEKYTKDSFTTEGAYKGCLMEGRANREGSSRKLWHRCEATGPRRFR